MGKNLIIINGDLGEVRVALIENGQIAELLLERRNERSLVGNIYRGRVTRVLSAMQAAFVDIGLEKHAFLHVSDLGHPEDDSQLIDGDEDSEPKGDYTHSPHRSWNIRDMIKEGESIPVQVSKDPISTKGCRVTTHISLPGRHLVYIPKSDRGGISRRITDEGERRRLGKILKRIAPKKGATIARTAAEGASADALAADANYLVDTWAAISKQYNQTKKPSLVFEEFDLPLRVARDRLNDSVAELVVDDVQCHERLRSFVDRLIPSRLDAIKLHEDNEPIFDAFGIEGEIKRALARRVELPSGGNLVIDQAEALTAIDVNTGSYVGKGAKDQEETITQTNLEAVSEIAYQLRFRNIGGLIVVDLIDMDRHANRRKVLAALKQVLQKDRAKTSVIKISQFGLVEMTRERTSDSLGRKLHEPCAYCDGTGHLLSRVTVANEALRDVRRRYEEITGDIELRVHPNVAEVFKGQGVKPLKELQKRIGKKIILTVDGSLHHEQFQVNARP
jgi:ribonuclease G